MVDVDAGKCNVSRQLALIINRNIVSWLWVPTCADLQSKQEKIMSTHFIIVPLFLSIILVLLSPTSALIPTIIAAHQQQRSNMNEMSRRAVFINTGILSSTFGGTRMLQQSAFASDGERTSRINNGSSSSSSRGTIIYQPLSINVDGVEVPVAAWYQSKTSDIGGRQGGSTSTSYKHRISISKIGKNLAGWKLPSFIDRNFSLRPSSNNVQEVSSSSNNLLTSAGDNVRVVLLCHGYLGSRFDLSHLGEDLASAGFVVLSPEYPESLAASYDATMSNSGIPIDRTIITSQLLQVLTNQWNIQPNAYGIVGHSLGCGTVDRTGNESWTRVCIAGGYPSLRGPKCLFIGSINDGAVSISRAVDTLQQYNFASLDEQMVRLQSWGEKLPPRSALIFNNPSNAPNHISFLAEGTNDAMVGFLSPLLPLARTLGIPVLDFDKYQVSRDSRVTAGVVNPLVVEYMKQMMNV